MGDILNFSKEQGLRMFDALSRTSSMRQIKPLDQSNYIDYPHRQYYDDYNLRIGDVHVMIPPEFIYVASESFSQNIQTLRQENSQKQKTGYHKRTVKIDLVFDGIDEINGYKVPGPSHKDGTYEEGGFTKDYITNYYYVDGLRTLLAQFKLTPFLPIKNDLLNNAYKIYTVALQSIIIENLDGFQNVLMAHLTLQEVEMMPYIEMPNIMFQYTIDWDLFRYYTQSIITERHLYKNLQSLPENKNHNAFKISILKETVLQTIQTDSKGNTTAKTIGDKKDGTTKEQSILKQVVNPDNYSIVIDSNDYDVHITSFQCSYANMLTSIQMSDVSSPTLQYLGGLDTQFGITFETTDINVVSSIEQCQIMNDLMVRNNPKVRGSIGFVKLESDFVQFCGSLYCTIESVETHTVQGLPGLYQVRLLCVSYDIAQSRREELNGFLPFDGHESNISELELSGSALSKSIAPNIEQCIDQSYDGLMKKIYQDNYAEWKLRTSMEVYPDLRLPTYDEVNQAIANINAFRKYNNKDQLPYSIYPIQETNIAFGNGSKNSWGNNKWSDNGGKVFYDDNYYELTKDRHYYGYVDPDFYVFYPNTYLSIYQEEQEQANQEKQSTGTTTIGDYSSPAKNSSFTVNRKYTYNPIYDEEEDTDSKIVKFIFNLKKLLGKHYCPLAEGEVEDYLGPMFDELGLITYVLKTMGIIPGNYKRLTYSQISIMDIFYQVSIDDIRKGDILLNSDRNDCCVCTGVDKNNNLSIITCTELKGVCESNLTFDPAYAYRILPLQEDYKKQGTSQSNPYSTDGYHYPDENGEIKQKDPTALETTEGYESDNPYGDDENKAYQSQSFTESTTTNNIYNNLGNGGSSSSGQTIDQDLGVWSPISVSELNDYINKHAPKNSPFRGNADIFIKAGQQSGLDPRYLLAHAALESGWGTSNIAKKKNNYFGIGAFDSSPYKSAYSFTSGLAAGIIEGAKWISNNYYNGKYSQRTLNQMRNNGGVHQYATDPQWHTKIASIMDGMPKNKSSQTIENNNDSGNSTYVDSSTTSTTTTIDNSEQIKLKEYERRNRANTANQLQEETKPIELQQASISGLSLPAIQDDGSAWTDGSVTIEDYRTMTLDEFDTLSRTVAAECEGETMACKMAMAQFLYDVSQQEYNGAGLTIITQSSYFKHDKTNINSTDLAEAQNAIQRVFQSGVRFRKNDRILSFTSDANGNFAINSQHTKYALLKGVNQHNFYGYKNYPTQAIGYNIEGYGVSSVSSNSVSVVRQYTVGTVDVSDVENFGKPIFIKASYFDSHDYTVGCTWQELNSAKNRIYTSFVDDCQYSAKGKLLKAFPAFLFCILDDQSQWYDGRKLWTNYYVYKPVINIACHSANDMPTDTCQITVTNTYHNLDRSSAALINYSISKDNDYCGLNRWLYKHTGMIIGGVKITNRLVQMHSILFNHTKVREGARVHLRMGYGSDPLSLAPIINGSISAMTLGDQISITVTSDGHELIQNVTSEKSKDINNGALGLFGLGATQEASNIISQIMVKRQSWMNHLFFAKKWFEGSKYNIEHFGLYINSGNQYALQGGIDTGIYEQYDLLMNIYHAATHEGWIVNNRHWGYMYQTMIPGYDSESNIVFNKYNMTPWDVFQICAQTMPEFITKPEMYQFDSRLFYGLPFELTKYRYDIINGTIYQECKSNTQMHYIDSITGIIENQVSVTGRNTFTNAKVIYTRGNTPKSTAVIHSDDTIDNSKQCTQIIDSCIVQDYLGWDAAWETLGISKQGKVAARRIGISNLLYGWEKQYQGQLLCLGMPYIKPHDYLMVNDFYTSLNGLCTVREVIHSFNNSTGFTTSIIPGVIGFSPEQDSQNIEIIASFLKLYGEFTEYSQSRKQIKENCERYATEIASLYKFDGIFEFLAYNGEFWNGIDVVSTISKDLAIANLIYTTIRAARTAGGIIKALKAVGQYTKTINEGIKVFKTVRNTFVALRALKALSAGKTTVEALEAGILTTGAATGTVSFGIGFAISVIVCIAIDMIVDAVASWIENRNTIVLLPLWWEGKPFICKTKDGEKILLIGDENSGSEENTGENGQETDEDEIALGDG
jgi:beta-N-acetylglucosaminidase